MLLISFFFFFLCGMEFSSAFSCPHGNYVASAVGWFSLPTSFAGNSEGFGKSEFQQRSLTGFITSVCSGLKLGIYRLFCETTVYQVVLQSSDKNGCKKLLSFYQIFTTRWWSTSISIVKLSGLPKTIF